MLYLWGERALRREEKQKHSRSTAQKQHVVGDTRQARTGRGHSTVGLTKAALRPLARCSRLPPMRQAAPRLRLLPIRSAESTRQRSPMDRSNKWCWIIMLAAPLSIPQRPGLDFRHLRPPRSLHGPSPAKTIRSSSGHGETLLLNHGSLCLQLSVEKGRNETEPHSEMKRHQSISY